MRAGYLLDTDWIIDHLNGVAAVAARLKELQPAWLQRDSNPCFGRDHVFANEFTRIQHDRHGKVNGTKTSSPPESLVQIEGALWTVPKQPVAISLHHLAERRRQRPEPASSPPAR